MSNVRVLQLKVGEDFNTMTITHELEDMQQLVGGYIECVQIDDGIDMWVNEEGKLDELPQNFVIQGKHGKILDVVVGDVFFSGTSKEGETASITDDQVRQVKKLFQHRTLMSID